MKKIKLPPKVKEYLEDKKKLILNPTTEIYLGKTTVTVLKKGKNSGTIKNYRKTGKTTNFKTINGGK